MGLNLTVSDMKILAYVLHKINTDGEVKLDS
ncbi:hypothetical protein SJAV_19180 [Sulfurisphaera javensis]|uniref:Uncharacterized protein n=1 Tax=Sulfurisphaera javensis TaxID=2049879 RepID=A0AAT9GT24_9CREN